MPSKADQAAIPERPPYFTAETWRQHITGRQQTLFLEVADVDWRTGASKAVDIDLYPDLALGNGGSWCRSDGRLGEFFNIDRIREGGRIRYVKLDSYKRYRTTSGSIPQEVRRALQGEACRVLATNNAIEIDHKDGRKAHITSLKADDFQPLSKPANNAKRQHCKACKASGRRFDARQLGYSVAQWTGAEDSLSCVGCFWHDPAEFNAQISKDYQKER